MNFGIIRPNRRRVGVGDCGLWKGLCEKMKKTNGERFRFIDLFAGCGGLTEGFYRQGYEALLHLEIDPIACKTLSTRMRHYGYSEEEITEAVMCDDITRDGLIEDMETRIHEPVDIIIGGPPCQSFSSVGRAQSHRSLLHKSQEMAVLMELEKRDFGAKSL